MRRTLIYLISLIFACSCNNEKKQAELARQQAYEDSIAKMRIEAEIAEQSRLYSIAEYAVGDVKFGMSLKEVEETDFVSGSKLEYDYYNHYSFTKEELGYITFEFYKDILCCVTICGKMEHYYPGQEMNVTISSLNRYEELFSQKYGNPVILQPIPKSSNFSNLPNFYEVYYWNNIGDKMIRIGIKNIYGDDYGGPFRAMCSIENDRFIKDVRSEEVKKMEEELNQFNKKNQERDSAIIELL